MTAFSSFYEPLRIILGDENAENVFEFTDEKLDGGLRTLFLIGRGPSGYSVSGAAITPDVAAGSDFARICYETALLMLGGMETISYTTRAISVRRAGDRKRDLLTELRMKISQLDSGDGVVTRQHFIAALRTWVSGMGEPCEPPEVPCL